MKKAGVAALLWCALGAGGLVRADAILIDHDGVDLSAIPAESVAAAASLRVLLRHASVGQGIGWGLDCLAGLKSSQSACKCFATGVYDRSNWVLEARLGDGKTKIDDLVRQVETRADQFDIFMMKYCYIDALGDSHPDWEYYRSRMERLEAQYPTKRFVWWTIPLTRDGQAGTDIFNAIVRSYCATHGKILFDIADIECHEPDGAKLTNAQGSETISANYTNEIHAGHLNVEGRIRVASALWRLMAAVAEDLQEPPDPRIVYVDDDADAPGNGSSWATAYRFLQDALADANEADRPVEIRVAQGTYRPDQGAGQTAGDRSASFALLDGVALRGGYAGILAPDPDARDLRKYQTALSGDLLGNDTPVGHPESLGEQPARSDNSEHVVTGAQITAGAILDGFTIKGGHHTLVYRDGPANGGPGVYLRAASPTLMNCRFEDNYIYAGDGGGLFNCDGSNPFVSGCIFQGNRASNGGGICNSDASHATILNCAFHNNHASQGGALCSMSSGPYVSNCIFSGNHATRGGAVCCTDRSYNAAVINCTFQGNRASAGGGAIWNSYSLPRSTNCIMNCILWGNTPDELFLVAPDTLVTHCDILAGWPGEGNIASDPLFANPGYWDPNGTPDDPEDDLWIDGDYHLKSQMGRWEPRSKSWVRDDVTSPCIDAGDPNSPAGEEPMPNGGRINLGAYGGTAEASKSPSGG